MAKSRKMRRVRNPDEVAAQTVAAQPQATAPQSSSSGSSKTPIILLAGVASVALAGAAWWFMIGRHQQQNFLPADQRTATYLENKAREEARFAASAEAAQRRTSQGTPQAGTTTNQPFSNSNHLLREWFSSHFSAPRAVPAQGDTSINVSDRDTIEAVQRTLMGLGYRRNGEGTCAPGQTGSQAHCNVSPSGSQDDATRDALIQFITAANTTVTGIADANLRAHTENPFHPEVFYAVARYVQNNPGYFWTEGADEARTMTMLGKFYTPITAPARGLSSGYDLLPPKLGEGAYTQTKCGADRAVRHIVVSSRRKRL